MLLNTKQRLSWILKLVIFGLLATLMISSELWMTDRNFPLVPITGKFIPLPYPIDYILYSAMIVLGLLLLIYTDNKPMLISLTVVMGLLMLADQMRWQNFNLYYFFIMLSFIVLRHDPKRLLNIVRISIVGYMVWSGLQNMNTIYINNVFPWIFEPFVRKILPQSAIFSFNYLGYVFPLLQIFAGIGLLFKPTRNAAFWIGISILSIIFLSLSPLGHNWNKIQLPYYIVLIGTVVMCFWETEFDAKELIRTNKSIAHIAALTIFIFLPALNFAKLYDDTPSFNDFSGKGLYCKVYFDDEVAENIPEVLRQYTIKIQENQNYFDVFYWSMYALKVGPYAERRVFLALEDYFCSFQQNDTCSVRVSIFDYNNPEQIE